METSLKRVCAYIIDIILVTAIVTLFTKLPFISDKLIDYNNNYEEYKEVIDDYKNDKITDKEYENLVVDINYKLNKSNTLNGIITIASLVIYFGIIQYFLDGKTVGKLILKIRVVDKCGDKPRFWQILLRSVILNNIVFRILLIVGVYLLNAKPFYHYASIISMIESIIESVILVMIIMRKDNLGLHDIIAKTKVVMIPKNDVTEAKIINEK